MTNPTNIKIGDQDIGLGCSVFIIAEIGSNHDGKIEQARKLISIAADAGCDAVKIQIPIANQCYVPNSIVGGFYGARPISEIIAQNEIPESWISELVEYGHEKQLKVGASADGFIGLQMIANAGVDFLKIPSFTISHIPLLKYSARLDIPIIISSGAHSLSGLIEAVDVIGKNVGILHCVSSYPTPPEDLNLSTIPLLKKIFDMPIGFSDHSLEPIQGPQMAVAVGATIIEKHITIDRTLKGTDHSFAIEPDELTQLVRAVRSVEADKDCLGKLENKKFFKTLFGREMVTIADSEQWMHKNTRLGIYFTRALGIGGILQTGDIEVFRCGNTEPGLHPRFMEIVTGAQLQKDSSENEPVTWEHIICKLGEG